MARPSLRFPVGLPGTVAAPLALLVVGLTLAAPAWGATERDGTKLPLRRVVLFNSGVGFFEHFGRVEDDAKVVMQFRIKDINDLLKSMVVQDFDGGQVNTVNYASKDPVTKTLKTFAIDLTTNPSLAQLLQQIRGERVTLDAPNAITGIIVGVETRKKQVGEHQFIDVDLLNLLADEGLRSVPLESVSKIKLADPDLDAELRKALAVLATAHATDKKSVELNFLGKGARKVRVGYIQEMPVWKTTYRLVLSDEAPLLQGWAIVENTSEEDWNSVRLSLISGRPISFTMDLYEPLYVPRPEVELELYASLRPQVYGQDLAAKAKEFAARRAAVPGAPPALAGRAARLREGKGDALALADRKAAERDAAAEEEQLGRTWNIAQGVRSVAQAGEVGNLFQYSIDNPVSLSRQQSAMLPIVNENVKGEKLSIYNPAVLAKHPLRGLKFTNATKLHLMQGPITVFDGGVYAGDAKIEDVPPGSERLISYAIDLETEVSTQSKSHPEELLSVKIIKGTLQTSRKFTKTHEYTIKNSGAKPTKVLVEHPVDPNWTLVEPKKSEEKARDRYRFAVEAKPGEPAALVVKEERLETQHLALTNLDENTIVFYLRAAVVSDKVKAALKEVVQRKHALQQVIANRQQLEQRVREIGEDQARIRQNMAQLDRTSDVYKNYVKKFSDQEGQIEKLREQIQSLRDQETGLRKALDEYLMALDVQ